MALPQERIEEREQEIRIKQIPCGNHATIELLKRIQARLGIDDIDLAFELNQYAKRRYLKWAKYLSEKDIRQFKQGKPLKSDKDCQIVNFIIRNMNKEDRRAVFYGGIGERNEAGGASGISGDQQARPIQTYSRQRFPLRPTGIQKGFHRERRARLVKRAQR